MKNEFHIPGQVQKLKVLRHFSRQSSLLVLTIRAIQRSTKPKGFLFISHSLMWSILSVTLKMFLKCIREMYNSKVINSQGSASGANAVWFLEHVISLEWLRALLASAKGMREVFFQALDLLPSFISRLQEAVAGKGWVSQHCSKMFWRGRFHTEPASPCRNGKRPSGKGKCFFGWVTRLGEEHLLGTVQSAAAL